MALNLNSVANWPAQVARFPDYFVVSLVRALNRDSGVAASTPEGAADAKDWLEQFGMERSEDIRKLIRSKHLQTLIYAKKWQQRYPGATPEASRLAMEIASDALGLKRPGDEKTIEFVAHWWSNESEYVMLQMWMPGDLEDAMHNRLVPNQGAVRLASHRHTDEWLPLVLLKDLLENGLV